MKDIQQSYSHRLRINTPQLWTLDRRKSIDPTGFTGVAMPSFRRACSSTFQILNTASAAWMGTSCPDRDGC